MIVQHDLCPPNNQSKNAHEFAVAPLGLQIGTTSQLRAEALRLERLRARGHWDIPRYDSGLRFVPEKCLEFLQTTCFPFRSEYALFPYAANGDGYEFYLDNQYFRSGDAELLYSVIRKYEPNHIVEVGSGYSTRLMAKAVQAGQLPATITSIDPAPRIPITGSVIKHVQSRVEEVDSRDLAASLAEGDILFIDSSHSVISGGDVPFLLLEVLPRLSKGVLIQIHDIHLPFEYPEEWITAGWGWNDSILFMHFFSTTKHSRFYGLPGTCSNTFEEKCSKLFPAVRIWFRLPVFG